jgi:hypothetical protein
MQRSSKTINYAGITSTYPSMQMHLNGKFQILLKQSETVLCSVAQWKIIEISGQYIVHTDTESCMVQNQQKWQKLKCLWNYIHYSIKRPDHCLYGIDTGILSLNIPQKTICIIALNWNGVVNFASFRPLMGESPSCPPPPLYAAGYHFLGWHVMGYFIYIFWIKYHTTFLQWTRLSPVDIIHQFYVHVHVHCKS